jgi:predicted ATP-dependent protease
VSTVLIPSDNEKDLKDLPAVIKKALKIVLVEHMDEVLAHALAVADPASFLKDGFHEIDDIYEVPGGPKATEIAHPAGVN